MSASLVIHCYVSICTAFSSCIAWCVLFTVKKDLPLSDKCVRYNPTFQVELVCFVNKLLLGKI